MSGTNPALWCSICVSGYWITVFYKVIAITPKIGKTPNVIPKDIVSLISRAIMLPLIVVWLGMLWQSSYYFVEYPFLAWVGTLCAFIALMLSLYCWSYMGQAWRIGIDHKEKTTLLMQGPFKHSRHPIYALSILLMLGSVLTVQTIGITVLFCIHWLLFNWEAAREERYLKQLHGAVYTEYMRKTNRFFPTRTRARDV